MSHSLGTKLSGLRHKGYITDIEYQRLKKALEQEPCEDAISRREAIKMFTYNYKGERIPNYDCDNFPVQIAMKTVKKMLRELPSVKPQEPKAVLYSGDGYADGEMVYDMAECPNCGYEYDYGDKDWGLSFCPSCGQKLNWERSDKK